MTKGSMLVCTLGATIMVHTYTCALHPSHILLLEQLLCQCVSYRNSWSRKCLHRHCMRDPEKSRQLLEWEVQPVKPSYVKIGP